MSILIHPLYIFFIFLCIGAEYFYSKIRKLNNYDNYETFSNFIFVGLDKLIVFLTGAEGGALALSIWNHRLMNLENLNPIIKYSLLFVLSELAYYLVHFYNHYVNIGWATHSMHHSPTKYNLTLGYRLGITRFFSLGWLLYLPIVYLGFSPTDIGLVAGITLAYQFFIHTELVPSLGFLEKFLNTPSNHRVHHADIPSLYNKNLGGVTMLFDRLFGTYASEPKEGITNYGIKEVMIQKNIWHEIVNFWQPVLSQFFKTTGPLKKLKVLFGSPDSISANQNQI